MAEKRVIITGATGMVGGCALRICLEKQDVSQVTAIGRRHTGMKHDKLHETITADFSDYSGLAHTLENQDTAIYCLGVYTGAVPDDLFQEITVDYTLSFARSLRMGSPQAAFCFLSGQGADQTERSRAAFARYKGTAEKALLTMGFPQAYIFRPGYIYPVTPRKEPNLFYRILRPMYPMLRRVYPNIGISSEELARAMVHAGLYGRGENKNPVLENRDIRKLVSQ